MKKPNAKLSKVAVPVFGAIVAVPGLAQAIDNYNDTRARLLENLEMTHEGTDIDWHELRIKDVRCVDSYGTSTEKGVHTEQEATRQAVGAVQTALQEIEMQEVAKVAPQEKLKRLKAFREKMGLWFSRRDEESDSAEAGDKPVNPMVSKRTSRDIFYYSNGSEGTMTCTRADLVLPANIQDMVREAGYHKGAVKVPELFDGLDNAGLLQFQNGNKEALMLPFNINVTNETGESMWIPFKLKSYRDDQLKDPDLRATFTKLDAKKTAIPGGGTEITIDWATNWGELGNLKVEIKDGKAKLSEYNGAPKDIELQVY